MQGVHEVVTTTSFYDQLSGTFDPNSKAFNKSGKASGSHSGPWSEGVITGSVEAEYSLNFNQQPEEVEAILVPQKGYEEGTRRRVMTKTRRAMGCWSTSSFKRKTSLARSRRLKPSRSI